MILVTSRIGFFCFFHPSRFPGSASQFTSSEVFKMSFFTQSSHPSRKLPNVLQSFCYTALFGTPPISFSTTIFVSISTLWIFPSLSLNSLTQQLFQLTYSHTLAPCGAVSLLALISPSNTQIQVLHNYISIQYFPFQQYSTLSIYSLYFPPGIQSCLHYSSHLHLHMQASSVYNCFIIIAGYHVIVTPM